MESQLKYEGSTLRNHKLSHLIKAGLAMFGFIVFAIAGPAVKADPLTLVTESSGFLRGNLL